MEEPGKEEEKSVKFCTVLSNIEQSGCTEQNENITGNGFSERHQSKCFRTPGTVLEKLSN